ncbi:MAG TPA: mannose-1-phosphate guanylyltransferase [Cyclobacteriaceae bacterium]|nr:mannose-1-phosphate guanylyltransferase [Cyclobacteriaceae bacterium]
MNKDVFVVLMAGGLGTRFWPYSRNHKPKQFLDILGTGKTLLQATADRFQNTCPQENIYVVTNVEHVELVKSQLPFLTDEQILAEPMRRNTAPCIAYATYKIKKKNSGAVMIVSPSDHIILNEEAFQAVINESIQDARGNDRLITLGIKPNRPETGYGYIQYLSSDSKIKKVKTFTEKPELSLAKQFLESGDFVWNSGIFIWSAEAIYQAFQRHLPELAEIFDDIEGDILTEKEGQSIRNAYSLCKNISIDYGVMEKAENVYVMLADFSWSDLGSWTTLHELSKKDIANNYVDANTMLYDSRNCVIKGPNDKLIVVQGLNGYLVGYFDNVLIICEKDKEAQFRSFVNDVKGKPDGSNYL